MTDQKMPDEIYMRSIPFDGGQLLSPDGTPEDGVLYLRADKPSTGAREALPGIEQLIKYYEDRGYEGIIDTRCAAPITVKQLRLIREALQSPEAGEESAEQRIDRAMGEGWTKRLASYFPGRSSGET